jgi:hypothetical protein
LRTASPATAAAEDVEDVEAAEHVVTAGAVVGCEEIGGGVGVEGVDDVEVVVAVVTGEDSNGVEGVVGVEGAAVGEVFEAAGAVEHALAEEALGPKVVPATALVVWVPLAEPPD